MQLYQTMIVAFLQMGIQYVHVIPCQSGEVTMVFLQEMSALELSHKESLSAMELQHDKKHRDMEKDMKKMLKEIDRLKKKLGEKPGRQAPHQIFWGIQLPGFIQI